MSPEFDLIARYFSRPADDAVLGVGDDAALLLPTGECQLAVTSDTLVCGVHFVAEAEPCALGHKALAVNLSDLAAMGARPRWVLLAITLPEINDRWLSGFADGFYALAQRYGVELVGGDTTRGPLALTITAIGEVPSGKALRRDQAKPGDDLWVSGQLGGAALALKHIRGDIRLSTTGLEACLARLHTPVPRVELGQALVGIASSAIDVSDGLVADAEHIADRSGVRIEIDFTDLPCAAEVMPIKSYPIVRQAILAGGDDYELLFSVPSERVEQINTMSAQLGLALTRIGRICAGSEISVLDDSGSEMRVNVKGHDHFG